MTADIQVMKPIIGFFLAICCIFVAVMLWKAVSWLISHGGKDKNEGGENGSG